MRDAREAFGSQLISAGCVGQRTATNPHLALQLTLRNSTCQPTMALHTVQYNKTSAAGPCLLSSTTAFNDGRLFCATQPSSGAGGRGAAEARASRLCPVGSFAAKPGALRIPLAI